MKYIPSNLTDKRLTQAMGAFNHAYNNTPLRMGFILDKYNTDHDENQNKLVPTYDVQVIENDGLKGSTSTIYRNCLHADVVGGLADFVDFPLRPRLSSPDDKPKDSMLFHDGTIVLLLCINGMMETAVIIGGLTHTMRRLEQTVNDGQKFMGEFNGLNFSVNDDGELVIVRRGKTDNKGLPQDDGASRILMEKDGSIELNDGKLKQKISNEAIHQKEDPRAINTEQEYEKFRIDSTGQKISTFARKEINVESKGALNTIVEKDATYTINGALKQEVAKTVEINAGNMMKLESAADFNIKSGGQLQIEASMTQVKGMFTTMGQTQLGGQGGMPFYTNILLISGVGFAGTPVISAHIPLTTTMVTGV